MDWAILVQILLVGIGVYVLKRLSKANPDAAQKRSPFMGPKHDLAQGLQPEELPRYEEWTAVHQSHTFKYTHWATYNWWKYKTWGAARLYVNDQLVDENTSAFPPLRGPLLATDSYSSEVISVQVFLFPASGWTHSKHVPLIIVNEKVIHPPEPWTGVQESFWTALEESEQVTPRQREHEVNASE